MTLDSLRQASAASLFLIAACCCGSASAQKATVAALPDAPGLSLAAASTSDADSTTATDGTSAFSSSLGAVEAQVSNPTPPQDSTTTQKISAGPEHRDEQTKRILGIIPNFRAVSANVKLPPQTTKDKFADFFQDSFDYSSVFVPALLAGYNQARNETPEFHQGGVGYSRYLWHSFVDQDDENLWVEFIVPVIAHEDTRYYTLGSGGFKKRAGYALKHVVICRDDAGKDVFNSGEIIGAGISAGLSNLYYPSGERTAGNTIGSYAINVGIDAFTFTFKEFWPDINHKLFHGSKPFAN
jgi:hypothetical protein